MKQYWILSSMLLCAALTAEYVTKDFNHLLGNVSGLDDELLRMHFKLYQGYVTHANELLKKIERLDATGDNKTAEFAGLKRMLGWELDGMFLHEYYFENLGQEPVPDKETALMKKIAQDFGSFQRWKADFLATGSLRGIGWVVVYLDPSRGKIINQWIDEHNVGHLPGGTPLLVMDVFEHAYITQFGLDRGQYLEVFFRNIHWSKVVARFETGFNN